MRNMVAVDLSSLSTRKSYRTRRATRCGPTVALHVHFDPLAGRSRVARLIGALLLVVMW